MLWFTGRKEGQGGVVEKVSSPLGGMVSDGAQGFGNVDWGVGFEGF